jgi:hypothetical protein
MSSAQRELLPCLQQKREIRRTDRAIAIQICIAHSRNTRTPREKKHRKISRPNRAITINVGRRPREFKDSSIAHRMYRANALTSCEESNRLRALKFRVGPPTPQ